MPLRIGLLCTLFIGIVFAQPQAPGSGATPTAGPASGPAPGRNHENDIVLKALTKQKWHNELGDIAEVIEIRYTSAPPSKPLNPTAPGAKNPLIIEAIVLIPKGLDRTKKHPFIVFPHQGIHSDFGHAFEFGAARDLVQQGYAVIGPDYRGSTGYGGGFYNQIDYGGLEVEDVFQAREWMLANHAFLDPKRAGIVGWSHGGMITLMNILQHPGAFAAAYAGVPVTDLILRLGYKDPGYLSIFSDARHIGKTVSADIQEYVRRSPITYAAKLETPLLVHGNTNDEDVNVMEVQRFLDVLKANGKKVESKIYENAPGGHEFGRLDTELAKQSRREIYKFLAEHLKPARPVN